MSPSAAGNLDRFWAKVEKTDTCWLWTGHIDRDGYGYASNGSAHRQAYELTVGPIPDGLQIDHLCFVRNCVNPAHLEAVTPLENSRRSRGRRTHCRHGHEVNEQNTYVGEDGRRHCRVCNRLVVHRRRTSRTRAVDALIANHRAEFDALLRREYEAIRDAS